MFNLPPLDLSGLLRTIINASRAALSGFALFGSLIATPWHSLLLEHFPAAYDWIVAVESAIISSPVFGIPYRALLSIFGVDSFLRITFVTICFAALLPYIVIKFLGWVWGLILGGGA